MNKFDEMRAAVDEAKSTIRAADSVAFDMGDMLIGRLRNISSGRVLCALKRELADYDMHRNIWREKK